MTDESVVIHDADADTYRDASGPLTIGGGGGPPTGAAGGVLAGTYPNPSFAADMATQAELDAHTGDTTDAHDASAVLVADAGGYYTSTEVEGALQEIGAGGIGGGGSSFGVETPAGTINGSNDTFTLSEAPDPSADLLLWKNGLLMKQGLDYTLVTDTITFDAGQIPQTGDILLAAIPTSGGGGGGMVEYDYVERTTDLNVTATTAAGAETVITGGSVAYDGSTRVRVEVFFPLINCTANDLVITLWDGATDLGRIGQVSQSASPLYGSRFLTPTAATHQYLVKSFKTGVNTIFAATPFLPGFLRISEA